MVVGRDECRLLTPSRARPPTGLVIVLEALVGDSIGKSHPLAAVDLEEYDPTNVDNTLCHDDYTCVICLEGITYERNRRALTCAHSFHKMCVLRWLKTKQTCPICRCVIHDDADDDAACRTAAQTVQ